MPSLADLSRLSTEEAGLVRTVAPLCGVGRRAGGMGWEGWMGGLGALDAERAGGLTVAWLLSCCMGRSTRCVGPPGATRPVPRRWWSSTKRCFRRRRRRG
jgi:hypothetical protein